MTIWAVLPAAGIGRRLGSNVPKQYLEIDGIPLILHSLRRLNSIPAIRKTIVVIHSDDQHWSLLEAQVKAEFGDRIETVIGGDERYQSVLNGLMGLALDAQDNDWVLVHDAVRPCVRSEDIENLISAVQEHPIGGLLGYPMDNTLKRVDENNTVLESVDRTAYWNALTPQMFRYSILKDAITSVVTDGSEVTDEASAIESVGHNPIMVSGNKDNIKITHGTDLLLANHILKMQADADESQ